MASDGPGAPRGGSRRTWLRAALLAGAWLILGQVSNHFVFPPLQSSSLWLPSGMALGLLVRAERREWPAYGIAMFFAEAMHVFLIGKPLGQMVLWGLGDSGEVLIGAWLLRRWPGPPLSLQRVRDVAGLLGALVPAAAFSATLGVGAVVLFSGGGPFGQAWTVWCIGDVLGGMLVASLVLAWVPAKGEPQLPLRAPELAGVLVLLALLAHLLFGETQPRGILVSLPYLSFPFVLWMATRYGPKGATLGSAVLGVIACLHTARGRGPFGQLPIATTPRDALLTLQSFLVVVNLSALCLAAMVCERRRAEVVQRRLAEAGAVLAESLDDRVTMPRIAQLLVPEMATGFAVWRMRPGGRLEPVAHTGLSRATLEQLQARLAKLGPGPLCRVEGREGTALLVRLEHLGQVLGAIALVEAGTEHRHPLREEAFAEDLAHRCALALENASLMEKAQEAIHVRDEFISIAAHELRTPLTALQLYLHNLARSLPPPPEAERTWGYFQRAVRQVARLSQLVENLLAVGHLESGPLYLARERLDLAACAEAVVERLAEDLRKADCTARLHLQAHPCGWWDRERLEEVLTHLLSNAMKFGPGHPIDIQVSQHGGRARLEVRDEGIGMEPEAVRRIFGRFERAVPSSEYGGLGLGLFLAREIVEAHGGSLHVKSQRGAGTAVTVELPAFPLAAHAEESAPPS